ncbi:MAG: hypothetical protein Q7K45_06745 [Nanoarchaeota archaeon]|nr:hypothetical protein [Nanoarchaeota archaeon]
MTTQHINEITLGNGQVIKEFFLEPGENAPISVRNDVPLLKDGVTGQDEMNKLVRQYHAEDFIEVGGQKIPAIYEGRYVLSDISMNTLEGTFEPNARFTQAIGVRRMKALKRLNKTGGHDGKNVSVRDWHISNGKVHLIGQAMMYTQFLATDAVQDALLKPDDDSFPESATLRDYVVVNGKECRKGTYILSNLLGAAFLVRAKGQDGGDYIVLGRRRRKGRTSEGSDLTVIGGTPMWEEEYFEQGGSADFAGYMKKLGTDEHNEELLLHPDEIKIGNSVYLVRTLVRAFDPFYTVDVDPAVTIEDIAARCYGNQEALKEHDRLYAVPRTKEGLQGLLQSGLNVNVGTIAGLHLDFENRKM